ncbi:MAG: GerMN domain-containing protein [Oscillospiraceae bacterium]|nr:GerMN domain-containing protein [Oscillospiraceae bacterium]
MKKMLCVIISFALSYTLISCDSSKESIQEPVDFYYCQLEMDYGIESQAISKEVRDAKDRRQDYSYLLSLYLNGPESYALYNPFPRSTSLKGFALQDSTAFVHLNSSFASLTGLDLTLACACITLTVCEMTGAQQVTIRADDALLDGNPQITMTSDSFLMMDDSNIVIRPE